MPPIPNGQPSVAHQTAVAFEAHRQRARTIGVCPTYRLDDLRSLVEKHLTTTGCPYCQGPVTAANLAIGHKVPTARGGKFTFRNLEISCADCAALKGTLDFQEFRELLMLLETWPKPVRQQFRARLCARPVVANLPRPGSLEWFTGAEEPHAPLDIGKRRYKSPFIGEDPVTRSRMEETTHEVPHG